MQTGSDFMTAVLLQTKREGVPLSILTRQDPAALPLGGLNDETFCRFLKNLLPCHSNSTSEAFPFLPEKADEDWSRCRHLQWR